VKVLPTSRILFYFIVFWIFFLVLLASVTFTAWYLVPRFAPQWIREKTLSAVHDSCPQCRMNIGDIQTDFKNGTIVFSDISYSDAPGHHTQIDVKVKRLIITLAVRKLLRKQILIRGLRADGVDFNLYEDARIPSQHDDLPPLSDLPPFVIESIKVSGSRFQYVHQIDLHDATKSVSPGRLVLTDIHGSTGAWATRKYLVDAYRLKETPVQASGVLEHSGKFEVNADVDPLSERGALHLSIVVKDQPLALVNDFFPFEAGFKLNGQLFSVSTVLDMNDGKIRGSLHARYSDLKIQVVDPKNSGVSNFLATIGTKVVIHREQGVNGKPEGDSVVDYERTADQSLLSAIFQGLGKSARDLVTH
jgi:hypothetical protein